MRPTASHRAICALVIKHLGAVAPAIGNADPVRRAMGRHMVDGAAALLQWTKDTTEAARRRAYGHAMAAEALAPFAPVTSAESKVMIGAAAQWAEALRHAAEVKGSPALEAAAAAEFVAFAQCA